MKKCVVKNIKWDVDYDEDGVSLPTELEVHTPDKLENQDDINEYVSDWLSDTFGFCHDGFELEWTNDA